MTTITAIIKAKNEAHRISEAIECAMLVADRVIVIDDLSEDATAKVSRSAGAEVVAGVPHGGLIDQLDKFGFGLVESGWILRLDADEHVTRDLASALRAITSQADVNGARFARLHMMFGGEVRHGGWFEPHQLAFFRCDSWDTEWSASMHSQVPVTGRIVTISPKTAYSVHHDYDQVQQFVSRSYQNYARTEAVDDFNTGERFSVLMLVWRPWKRFIGRLVVRRGYRDGKRGVVLAALLAAYDIVYAATLWELGKDDGGDH